MKIGGRSLRMRVDRLPARGEALRRQVFRSYEGPPSGDVARYCPRCAGACDSILVSGRLRPSCGYCGHIQFRNPLPGVAIAIRDRDRVLLGKRCDELPFGGAWALPAGFIEFDEDFLTAARREACEETGLEVRITGVLNVSTNYLTERLHTLVIAVGAVPVGGELRPSDELSDLRWFAPAGALPPLAYEADRALLCALASASAPFLPVDDRFASSPERDRR
jgi:8-oxo-dGTP diphosphatase